MCTRVVSRGGWTKTGQWVPVPYVDAKAAELLLRHKVLSLLRKAGVIDEERIALLLSWKHSGFSVHNGVSVEPEDPGAIERLVRYVMRSPVSQQRLDFDGEMGEVRIRAKAGADDGAAEDELERLDPDEVVARVIVQIPDPRRHLIRSYGRYANAARAKRKRDAAAAGEFSTGSGGAVATDAAMASVATKPDSAERKAARKRWANLIRHIYEADPLVCPRCGGVMKIVSFITEQRVIRPGPRFGATNRHAVLGRLAPPPAPRSPGRGRRAVSAGRRWPGRWPRRRRACAGTRARDASQCFREATRLQFECFEASAAIPNRT